MYQSFYGFRELPFELTPNPKYLFLTPRHQEALSNLQYGLFGAKAVTVLIGEAGTGKTTLLRAALESESCRNVRSIYLTNPALTRAEFIETLARNFRLSAEAGRSKAVLLPELEAVLHETRSRGEITALIVDEAQSLSTELLEEIRLLANIETASQKLLPLVLVGQPELSTRLEDPAIRQLKQRIALRCEVLPFTLDETSQYIAARIKTAGAEPFRIFTREAVKLVYAHSRGIPRTINVMCDNALVHGLALYRKPINREVVAEVARDFHLGEEPNARPAALDVSLGGNGSRPPVALPAASNTTRELREAAEDAVGGARRALPWEVTVSAVASGSKS